MILRNPLKQPILRNQMGKLIILIWTFEMAFGLEETNDLNIMGFFPMTGEVFRGGKACLLGSNMALQHINQRDDILHGYRLNLIWRDSKCSAGQAMNMMYEMLYESPTKIMILGPGCSTEAEVLAQATPAWNITHLSWGGASPLLSDRRLYPRFFRIAAPDTRFNYARIELARLFNWKKIATIHVSLDYFSAVTDHLVNVLKTTDISIISEEIFEHDPFTRLQSLKRKDARIIFAAGYENHGKRILCAAYRAGLYGPKVVWMFPGWYQDQWWKVPYTAEVPCTEDQMALVAEGSILTGFYYANIRVERGIANLTVPEYKELYRQEEAYQHITEFEHISPNCYDAVWGIALALNCTDRVLHKIGHAKSLDQFSYSDRDIADITTSCTRNVSFLGITGQVEFDITGEPLKNVKVDQIQGGRKVLVGIYRTDVDEWFMEWHNGGIVWQDGVPPRDSTLVTEIEILIPKHLYVTMASLAGFGILLSVSLGVFNVVHRANVYVKLSSPNINNVLLLGCMVTYSSVFMESLEQQSVSLCKMRTFTLIFGFSMAFGALFSKTWRVYKIFSNKKLLHMRIRDYQLVGLVFGIVGIHCIVLIVWEIVDPLYIEITKLEKESYLIGTDAVVLPYIRLCISNYFNYFTWTIYILGGVLLAFGAFLAFETRKVKIEALNDSRLIGWCLYNVIVLSAVALTLNLALEHRVGLVYGITSGILIIGTTLTQLVVFIPKILAVYYPHRVEGDGAVMKSIGTTSMKYNGTSDGNSAGITHTRITNLKGSFANANSDI